MSLVMSPSIAETVFFVDTEGIAHCSALGQIGEGFAAHKHAGMSQEEMQEIMISGDVDAEVAELLVRVIYSFDATETQTYRSVLGALCILDLLQPIEITR